MICMSLRGTYFLFRVEILLAKRLLSFVYPW